MGCCFSKKTSKKTPLYNPNDTTAPIDIENTSLNLEEQQRQLIAQQKQKEGKRDNFIDNFFSKNLGLNAIEKSNAIFITNLNKKMFISKDLITVEEDFILKVNLDNPNCSYNNYWMFLDADNKDMISREIYIDDIKVNDSQFEVDGHNIKLDFENTYNNQTRKVKIIEKIKNQFNDYNSNELILSNQGIAARYLIYLDSDLTIDEVTNKNYVVNKDLNLAYFEGITTQETENSHGYINYSKKFFIQIYKYIPELSQDKIQNIIRTKEANGKSAFNILSNYQKFVITDYGLDIDEIRFMKISNYKPGQFLTEFGIGLYQDVKCEIDTVTINGKPFPYQKYDDSIHFNNLKLYNNQYMEAHLKYKYYTNEQKAIYRKENILISYLENSYVKYIVQLPDEYVVIGTNDLFTQSPDIPNMYYYQGIPKKDKMDDVIRFCRKKAKWDIEYEYTLDANSNIKDCEFSLNKVFKGGNLKELKYDINKNGATLEEQGNKYIFKYGKLNTNVTKLHFRVQVENSTSNYIFNENSSDYIKEIPPNELNFWKSLANQIISMDKTNCPNYKKIGKWVYNNITYNLSLTGKKFTAMEIYNNKQGVCEHFTLLYNTLLNAYGIEAFKVAGYAKDITEYNTEVKHKKDEKNNSSGEATERHAWTLAKIDGEWVPLDATWNLFDKKVPITHVFKNYGDTQSNMVYMSDCKVDFNNTKENVIYVKN